MNLFEKIKDNYPELDDEAFHPFRGIILLQNDSDGLGDYIAKWDYSKPIPEGLKIGK